MSIEFLSVAEEEFRKAVFYYNQQSAGLGYEFALEVERTLERILQYPKAWTSLSENTRRCRTNRFPFGLIYQIRPEKILILAVMHLHREPNSWKNRIQSE